ncbi:hypothetical protein SP41_94 [Salmonella phage 41]|nr:hypothetical protein SP41_94 [Salmonella phage 41]
MATRTMQWSVWVLRDHVVFKKSGQGSVTVLSCLEGMIAA